MTQYQPHTPPKLHNHGFTLVELMVTIAVLGIIAAIATPSFSLQLANKRTESTSSVIAESLKTAITESAIRHKELSYTININNRTITIADNGSTIQTFTYERRSNVQLSTGAPTTFLIGPGKKTTYSTKPNDIVFSVCDESRFGSNNMNVTFNAIAQVIVSRNGSCP